MKYLVVAVLLIGADVYAEQDPKILVQAHCSGCHSLQLVESQRGDRDYWLKTIRWMQKTQNLWQIPEPQENVILDYLAENYAEEEWGRRPNLSLGLQSAEFWQ